jgi:hypothetical protein
MEKTPMSFKESYEENDKVKVVVASIHGIMSKGKNLHRVMEKIKKEFPDYHYTEVKYGYTNAILNYAPWARNIVRDYVAFRISCLSYKYRNAKIIVIAHSNGTYALGNALEKWYENGGMRVGMIVLVGSVIKRKFNWNRYPNISVVNIVATRDWISLMSKWAYFMGQSGVKGFKYSFPNLMEYRFKMGHTGYIKKAIPTIINSIKKYRNLK